MAAGENAHTRHDERDAVSTGDLADTARLHEAHIPRGRLRRQAGRERPPGTASGPVAGAKGGVAHAPFLIVRPGRRWLARHRTPLDCGLERWRQTVDWVGLIRGEELVVAVAHPTVTKGGRNRQRGEQCALEGVPPPVPPRGRTAPSAGALFHSARTAAQTSRTRS